MEQELNQESTMNCHSVLILTGTTFDTLFSSLAMLQAASGNMYEISLQNALANLPLALGTLVWKAPFYEERASDGQEYIWLGGNNKMANVRQVCDGYESGGFERFTMYTIESLFHHT